MKSIAMSVLLSMAACSAFAAPMYGSVDSTFDVKATVDSFVGKASSEAFTITEGDAKVTVVYTVAGLETGKKKRDKEMMHMFSAEEFPMITGSADAKTILALTPSDNPVDLEVELTMHGVTKTVAGKVSKVEKADGSLAFDLEFPVVLSDFGLKAPSIMGLIRVNNTVQVASRVTLTNDAPVPDAAE